MSFKYDRYETRRPTRATRTGRSVFGYWVPVVITTSLAIGGLVAWVWSARDEHETSSSSDDEDLSYGGETDRERDTRRPPSYGVSEGVVHESASTSARGAGGAVDESTLLGRVHGVIRRTPSPQQLFDAGSKRVAAGVAAAGAVVGGALSSIREEERDDYQDHQRWREEGSSRSISKRAVTGGQYGSKRRTVAIVLSAEEYDVSLDEEDAKGWKSEHAVSKPAGPFALQTF